MKLRKLGKTGLQVSEIGFGGEWLERHSREEGVELIHYAASKGINILDCWMADPNHRKRHQGQPGRLVYPGAHRLHLERWTILQDPGNGICPPRL